MEFPLREVPIIVEPSEPKNEIEEIQEEDGVRDIFADLTEGCSGVLGLLQTSSWV